jgi:hypothetical protein
VISYYYWQHKTEPRPTISEFIDSGLLTRLSKKGYGIYTINDEIVVDRVCRYESLEYELENVRKLIGIPGKLVIPYAKAGYRKDKRHYREVLNAEDKEKIAKIFKKEIQLFNYTY